MDKADVIERILSKLEPGEKDVLLEALIRPDMSRSIKPYMTAHDFTEASGIPEKRVRQALKGQYANQIAVKADDFGCKGRGTTSYIDTAAFLKLWKERKLF